VRIAANNSTMTEMIHAGEIVFEKHTLYQVRTDTKLSECANLLKEKNILSVPVWDAIRKQYVGIIDSFDLMKFTAIGFFEEKVFHDDLFEKFTFAVETAGDLVSQSARSRQIVVLEATDTLSAVLKAFKETRAHRCLVRVKKELDSQVAYRLMTQSDMVGFLSRRLDQVSPSVSKKRIEELGLVNPLGSLVVTCRDTEIAAQAFLRMADLKVTAVAVVNEQGFLVTTLSSSDLRGLSEDNLKYIKLPVLEFLKAMRGGDERIVHPVTCSPRDTLEKIFPQVTAAKIHRVWVTNSAKEPIGVVTLTDILSVLVV